MSGVITTGVAGVELIMSLPVGVASVDPVELITPVGFVSTIVIGPAF